MLETLPEELRGRVVAALEQHAIFKAVDGVVYCCAYKEGGWRVWPLNGGEEAHLDAAMTTCTCGVPLCPHIRALKYGGDTGAKWDYTVKRKRLGKWYVHKHS